MYLFQAHKNNPTNAIPPASPGRSRLQTASQGNVYHYQSHSTMTANNRQLIPKKATSKSSCKGGKAK